MWKSQNVKSLKEKVWRVAYPWFRQRLRISVYIRFIYLIQIAMIYIHIAMIQRPGGSSVNSCFHEELHVRQFR